MPVFDGVDQIVDDWLGLTDRQGLGTKFPKYKTKSAAIQLSENGGIGEALVDRPEAIAMINDCIEQISKNLGKTVPPPFAPSNWDWEKSLKLDSHNPSQEKVLEKFAAFFLGDDWMNQMPVCNGMAGENASARRIDLVHRRDVRSYDFIELKFADTLEGGSDHPLYAAIELFQYGLLYLYVRKQKMRPASRKKSHHVLDAESIRLVVLAPLSWYSYRQRGQNLRYDFGWLQSMLNEGLGKYCEDIDGMDNCSFSFEALTGEFSQQYRQLTTAANAFRSFGLAPRVCPFD